jgi:hypothetical protein
MQFLQHRPKLALCGAGDTTTFFAELYNHRPAFEEILKFEDQLLLDRAHIAGLIQRRNNKLASMDLIVDGEGICGLFVFCSPLGTGNAKSAVSALIRKFDPLFQTNLLRSLRPFDELDSFRVQSMQTISMLRPGDVQEPVPVPQQPATGPRVPWQQLATQMEHAMALNEGLHVVALLEGQTLSLSDVCVDSMRAEVSERGRLVTAARKCWITLAQESAAVSILSIGAGSSHLSYIHCVHEERRRLLLRQGLVKPSYPDLVERGLQLAALGSLPVAHGTSQQRKAFLKRCEATVLESRPGTAIEHWERRDVEVLMGAAPPCDMCTTARTARCFEWDHNLCRWTCYGALNMDSIFAATCRSLKPLLPRYERSLCTACARLHFHSCDTCRSSTDLIPGTRDCKCGGLARGAAPFLKPPSLRERMTTFLADLEVRKRHELRAETEEELEEQELRASVKRSYDNLAEAVEGLTL